MPVFKMPEDGRANMHGVAGRWTHHTTKPGQAPGLWFRQRFVTERREYKEGARTRWMQCELRFDDECGNGFNSFAITGESGYCDAALKARGVGYRLQADSFGCLHEDAARVFPELAHLIPFHLFDSRGPMHYAANAVYLAGDRDHWGKRKGEPHQFERRIVFGSNPIEHAPGGYWNRDKFAAWVESMIAEGMPAVIGVEEIPHKDKPGETYKFSPHYTLSGYACDWTGAPFDSERKARNFAHALTHCAPRVISVPVSWGEGKARELDAARRAACWPDATDAELMQEPDALRAALEARLPALVESFNSAMRAAGFYLSPHDTAGAAGVWEG